MVYFGFESTFFFYLEVEHLVLDLSYTDKAEEYRWVAKVQLALASTFKGKTIQLDSDLIILVYPYFVRNGSWICFLPILRSAL